MNESEQEILEAERAQGNFLDVGNVADAFSALNVDTHMDAVDPHPIAQPSNASSATHPPGDEELWEEDPEIVEQAFHNELFQFLPPDEDAMDVDQAGPSHHRRAGRNLQLDDEDDERVVVEYEGAARMIRMRPEIHQLWREKFGAGRGVGKQGQGGGGGRAQGGKEY